MGSSRHTFDDPKIERHLFFSALLTIGTRTIDTIAARELKRGFNAFADFSLGFRHLKGIDLIYRFKPRLRFNAIASNPNGAVFFPAHDSEQRHAAECNHCPCRGFGDGRNCESNGFGQTFLPAS